MKPLDTPERRTKRRYAHELYPHADEDKIRPLSVEVPYLYAHALGWDVWGTGWSDAGSQAIMMRFVALTMAREHALLADALLQGLTGDAAWRWAREHMDESGELVWDRAAHHGVHADRIKPYPCGDEPDRHECCAGQPPGTRINVPGREVDCPHCSEPVGGEEPTR